MKKMILFLICTTLLCSCSLQGLPNDECGFLTGVNWEGNDTQCNNVISFNEDGSFSNWCYCGSPIGASDVVEGFRYRASDQTIHLLDDRNEIIETGTIQYVDDMYLIIDLWDQCYVYENVDVDCPTPRACALEHVGTEEMTKPYLSILGYENGILTVSSYSYDADAAASFDTWTLPTHADITFSSVNVTVENTAETLEVSQLTTEDYQYIGEFYTTGYIELNSEGEVTSIVFYGETITTTEEPTQP